VATPKRFEELLPNAAEVSFGEVFEIRDLRNHSAGTLITLALLLAGVAQVTPDPKRKDFFEVEGGSETYYIHVSPVNRIIYLLAVWQKSRTEEAGRKVTHMISPSLWRSVSGCAHIPPKQRHEFVSPSPI
jgi:hypothetical protein